MGAYLDQLGVHSDEAQAVRAMLGCSEIRNTTQYLSGGEATSSAANSKTGLVMSSFPIPCIILNHTEVLTW